MSREAVPFDSVRRSSQVAGSAWTCRMGAMGMERPAVGRLLVIRTRLCADAVADRFSLLGTVLARYGLVVVLAWIGVGKYVKMESRVLIESSPLMSWLYDVLSFDALAHALGTAEIAAAVLIAVRPIWPGVSAVGSALAVVLFSGTVSFLFTSPGVVGTFAGALPVLSAQPGQFLLKDLVLLGVAVWTLGESLAATAAGQPRAASTAGAGS
jgi:uncharacterized membrane protein YkgB